MVMVLDLLATQKQIAKMEAARKKRSSRNILQLPVVEEKA